MEEKQVEVKQETMPAQEPKRPLLLSIAITWGVLRVFIVYLVEILRAAKYEPHWNLNWVLFLVVLYAVIFVCLYLGYKWARVIILPISFCLACDTIVGVIKGYMFNISNISNLSSYVLVFFDIFVFLYLLLNKDVKAYCRK